MYKLLKQNKDQKVLITFNANVFLHDTFLSDRIVVSLLFLLNLNNLLKLLIIHIQKGGRNRKKIEIFIMD
jgi:hypothetical protein